MRELSRALVERFEDSEPYPSSRAGTLVLARRPERRGVAFADAGHAGPEAALARAYGVIGSSRSVGPPPRITTVSSGRPAPSPM